MKEDPDKQYSITCNECRSLTLVIALFIVLIVVILGAVYLAAEMV